MAFPTLKDFPDLTDPTPEQAGGLNLLREALKVHTDAPGNMGRYGLMCLLNQGLPALGEHIAKSGAYRKRPVADRADVLEWYVAARIFCRDHNSGSALQLLIVAMAERVKKFYDEE